MSSYRCGLQISRCNIITDEIHDHPRSKVVACLIDHDIFGAKESHMASDMISNEVINQLELDRETKADIKEQEGSGILDILRALPVRAAATKIASMIPEGIAGKVATAAGAAMGTALVAKAANYFNKGSDETAREINLGEKHAILKLPNGKYGIANYQGPGTDIIKRIRAGDPPRTETDLESMAHDMRYALSENPFDVRDADNIYVNKMKQLQREGLDSSINIQPALRTIQAKMIAEDYSMLSRDAFIDTGKKVSAKDRRMLVSSLDTVQQLGYGKNSQKMIGGFSVESKGMRMSPNHRGVPEVDSWQTMSLSERVKIPLVNALGRFQDRAFRTTLQQPDVPNYRPSVADNIMRGGSAAPGRPGPASSQKIKVSTATGRYVRDPLLPRNGKMQSRKNRSQNGGQLIPAAMALGAMAGLPLLAKGVEKLRRSGKLGKKQQKAALMAGRGYRSSNIVDVGTPGYSKLSTQIGSGRHQSGLSRQDKLKVNFPADRLLKKMQKKLKRHIKSPHSGRRLRKPMYMDDYELSHMMADKLAPMVMAY